MEFVALDNYLSACLLQPELEAYLAEDLALGHLAKVHISQVVSPLCVHPITLVPKPGQHGKFRLITDISSPAGTSINDLTPPPPPFWMVKVRNLFRRIWKFMWGGKFDMAHTFHNILLASLFAGHLAFHVGDYYYFELHLPFGFTWSPFVWNSFSNFIQRYCALQEINCVVYCNNFLVLAPNKNNCFQDMSFLLEALRLLGVLVKPSKVVWPSQSIEFLGLVLDFVAMTVLASPERVASILDILRDFLSRKSMPFSKFKRLVGKLSFVAQIISGSRTFLQRLFDAYPSSRHSCVKISPSAWLTCLGGPVSYLYGMVPSRSNRIPIAAVLPSLLDTACGGVSMDQALVHIWSPQQCSWHINIKELWSVYWYFRSWSPKFKGATIMIGCNN
jgi:hypothetical protein